MAAHLVGVEAAVRVREVAAREAVVQEVLAARVAAEVRSAAAAKDPISVTA